MAAGRKKFSSVPSSKFLRSLPDFWELFLRKTFVVENSGPNFRNNKANDQTIFSKIENKKILGILSF